MLQRFREKGLTLNGPKCRYNKFSLEFYGLIFSKDGVKPDPKLVSDFVNALRPQNANDVRSLLGMAQYCAKFVEDYATITEPLRELTQKNVKFVWNPKHQQAWDELKQVLTSEPVLCYFDINKYSEITVDASPFGLSAILTQKSSPTATDRKVITYASRALSSVECKYSQTEREALAVVWGCERMQLFLYGADEFDIYTDHKALEVIYNKPSKPPACIERWQLRLHNYSFRVIHQSGSDNPSDYMSRHPAQHLSDQNTIAEEYVNFVTSNAVPEAMTLEDSSWLVATPWLVPILLRPLVKVRGSSPRRGSSPPYSLYRPRRDARLSTPCPVECRFMNY